MKGIRYFTLLLTFYFNALGLFAQDSWEWRSPTPTGNRLGSFVYGNGLFVGVGESGAILTSTDGATWTNRESGVSVLLRRVVFDGTRFVAVGGLNILTSTDGNTWTNQIAPAQVFDVSFGNGTFVAVVAADSTSGSNRLLTSSNGTTWTLRDNPTDVSPSRVFFANGVFIALGNNGNVLRSTNAIDWTPVTVLSNGGTLLGAAGNNVFVVSLYGHTFRSTDGIAWSEVTTTDTSRPRIGLMGTLGFGGGFFYADEGHHGHGVFRSADGATWTQATDQVTNDRYGAYFLDLSTLASGGGITIASESPSLSPGSVNAHAYYVHSSKSGLPDESTWSNLFPSPSTGTDDGSRLLYGLGRYFFAGKSSPDGLTWTDCGFAPTHVAGNRLFRIVSQHDGVVMPEINSLFGAITTVETSTDGLTATEIDVKIPTPHSVAFGAGRYVMVGENGTISTSTDATSWAVADSGTAKNLNAVLFAFNRFIAVGDEGTLISSSDGLTWKANAVSPGNFRLKQIAAGTDRIVITGAPNLSGTTSASITLDGTTTPISVAAAHQYAALTFYNGVFLAVSYESNDPGQPAMLDHQLWKSVDGLSWTAIPVHVGFSAYNFFTPTLASGNGAAMLLARPGAAQSTPIYFAILQTPYVGSQAPVITHPPVAVTFPRGETARFSLGVTGSGPLTYQWYHDGVALSGASQSVLTLTGITDADAGDYTVKVTNSSGSVTSTAGHLTVITPAPLTITEEPVGGTLYEFQLLSLHVSVSGSGPYSYQWRRNGVPITSATTATYQIWVSSTTMENYTGSYDVVVSAPYSTATSQKAIVTRGVPLVTLDHIAPFSVAGGSTLQITATATGAGPFTYRWFKPGASNSLVGATGRTLMLPYMTENDAGIYEVEVTDVNGQTAHASVIVIVNAQTPLPASGTATAANGQDLTLRAGPGDPSNDRFQWRHNGANIAGATSASYTIHNFSTADEGTYDVVMTAADGSISTGSVLRLTLDGSRLVNLSTRAFTGSDEDTLIQGFVLKGASSAASPNVLVRSIGPTLATMGVNGTLADPSIRVLDTDHSLVAVNDNWSTILTSGRGIAATSSDMAQFGAFSLPADSRDSAVLIHETPAGPYTALVSAVPSGTGIVLNEIYGPTSGSQRLVNLSARARVGAGDAVLIAGFVISGTGPLKVLVRGVGPALAKQGVTAPVANPKITLFDRAGVAIHNNDNWGQAANLADLRAATTATGAFALAENSNDAAMLETLEPGVYTVHVASVDGMTGIALVEIYEAP